MIETPAGPTTLCAVMPIHAKVSAEHLCLSLESLVAQHRPADEIILVEDGPLPPDLSALLTSFLARRPEARRIRLAENLGAGAARQVALEAARSDVIALQDSDDISVPERFRSQFSVLEGGDVDMVGSAMLEFRGSPDEVVGLRSMPESPSDIARYARLRMPVNNPTAMFRRELALAVGGYRPLAVNEDYDLVARVLVAGGRIRNLPDALVLFRTGHGMFRRRKAREARRCEVQLQRNLCEYGLVSGPRAVWNVSARILFRLLPAPAMRLAYRRLYLQDADAQMCIIAPSRVPT